MQIFLLLALLALPVTGFAQSTCYSPSDCAGIQHCSTLDDGVTPGKCVPVPEVPKKIVKPVPVAAPVVKKSASSSSSSIVPSSFSSSSSSSSSSSFSAEDQSKLKAAMDSLMQSMNSMMNSMNSMFEGMMKSFTCMFGCKE